MPSNHQPLPLISSPLSLDGALIGAALGLAYAAVCSFQRSRSLSAALSEIQKTPTFRLAGLRLFIDIEDSDEPLLVLRSTVDAKLAFYGESWKNLRAELLVIPRTPSFVNKAWNYLSGWASYLTWNHLVDCIYNAWKDFFTWVFGWASYMPWNRRPTSPIPIPFIVSGGDQWLQTDGVIVKLMVSRHPLPLTIAYDQLIPTKHTLLRALSDHKHHVGLDEEKILSLGKEIGAFGICSFNRVLELKKYMRLPYFLTDATKDQIMSNLALRIEVLFWGGIFLGCISISVLGYSVVRNWNKLIVQMDQRRRNRPRHASIEPTRQQQPSRHASIEPTRQQQPSHSSVEPTRPQPRVRAVELVEDDEEIDNVPDNELCVVCLMSRRIFAFLPCGHLVCCDRCAVRIESATSAKCPVCCQYVQCSVRIFIS